MIESENYTQDKIVIAALELFSDQGIQKTSLQEVAYRAGVTRVTVYRHFADKKALVRAAFVRSEAVFLECVEELDRNPKADWSRIFDRIGEGLASLPSRDLAARLSELKRLYPDVYADFQEARVKGLDGIFDRLVVRAERKGVLRPGLTSPLIRALFWDSLVNLFDNPHFAEVKLSDAELFRIVKETLLYGIFVGEPEQGES